MGWKHVRAALLALHAAAVVLSALPSPAGGLNRKNWQDPTVQNEMHAWAARVGMAPDAFEDRAFDFAVRYQAALDVVLAPVDVYEHWTGQAQSWKMFVAPHRFPARMQLQVEEDGAFRTVFEERSPEFRWHAERFELERLRASIFRWSWPGFQKYWSKACKAFAAELLADFPDATAARCRFWKAASPSARQVRDGQIPDGEYVYPLVVPR